jgi:hypothetical protein
MIARGGKSMHASGCDEDDTLFAPVKATAWANEEAVYDGEVPFGCFAEDDEWEEDLARWEHEGGAVHD